MAETEPGLHPNWKALATVHLNYKIFKKASDTNQLVPKEDQNKYTIKLDEEASKAYEEILEIPSESSNIKKKPKRRLHSVRAKQISINKQHFFRAAASNDPETIENVFRADRSCINWIDSFGWTALMMAACEGAVLSFRKLLSRGANLSARDNIGKTSEDLAVSKNHQQILEEIRIYKQCQNETIELSDDEIQAPIYCAICEKNFMEATLEAHTSSTLHLFNSKSAINTSRRSFGISRSNRGYKIMMKFGWDQQSALGSSMQGQLYPIKTVLRKKNSGLGLKQTPAKITHFGPNDVQAIKYVPPMHFPNKKQINENFSTDKKIEYFLRHQLSPNMSLPKEQEKSYEIIIKTERVADQIMQNKQELVELDRRRNSNREAIRDLNKSSEKKVWMTVGSILVEMNNQQVLKLMQKDQDEIEKLINNLRDDQHKLLNKHNDLEQKTPAHGFNLKPLSKIELGATIIQ